MPWRARGLCREEAFSGSQGNAASMGGEVEVEVKGSAYITPIAHLQPTKYPVCAPPQGVDPCSNFKWLLREGQPFSIPSDGAGCSQHQGDKRLKTYPCMSH